MCATMKESAQSGVLGEHLQEIENNLPEDPKYRMPKLGAAAPIRVVNEVFAAGDGATASRPRLTTCPMTRKLSSRRAPSA